MTEEINFLMSSAHQNYGDLMRMPASRRKLAAQYHADMVKEILKQQREAFRR
jgi:hypothetical protein